MGLATGHQHKVLLQIPDTQSMLTTVLLNQIKRFMVFEQQVQDQKDLTFCCRLPIPIRTSLKAQYAHAHDAIILLKQQRRLRGWLQIEYSRQGETRAGLVCPWGMLQAGTLQHLNSRIAKW